MRMNLDDALRLLKRTRVLLGPKKSLAPFGDTRIRYHLVSPVEDMDRRARLREGVLVSERPKILTPDHLRDRFQGFGEEARAFGEWLLAASGDKVRALEYRFRNELQGTRVLSDRPQDLAGKILRSLEEAPHDAILLCPDAGWQVAVMKLLLDETRRAFGGHVRELEAKGMFRAPDERRRDEVESLFKRAAKDRSVLGLLGSKLKEYGLFGDYEDRFYTLL